METVINASDGLRPAENDRICCLTTTVLRSLRPATERNQQRAPTFMQSGLLDLPASLGNVDAIVGHRVLMYQPDTVPAVTALAKYFRQGGTAVHSKTGLPLN